MSRRYVIGAGYKRVKKPRFMASILVTNQEELLEAQALMAEMMASDFLESEDKRGKLAAGTN